MADQARLAVFLADLNERRDRQRALVYEMLEGIDDVIGVVMEYVMDDHVVVGDERGCLHFVDLEQEQATLYQLRAFDSNGVLVLAASDRYVAAAARKSYFSTKASDAADMGLIKVWSLQAGMKCCWRLHQRHLQPVKAIEFVSSNRMLAAFQYTATRTAFVAAFDLDDASSTVRMHALPGTSFAVCRSTRDRFICNHTVYDAVTMQPIDSLAFENVFYLTPSLLLEEYYSEFHLYNMETKSKQILLPYSLENSDCCTMMLADGSHALVTSFDDGVQVSTLPSTEEELVRSVSFRCERVRELMQVGHATLGVLVDCYSPHIYDDGSEDAIEPSASDDAAGVAFELKLVNIASGRRTNIQCDYREKRSSPNCMSRVRFRYTPAPKRAAIKRKREEEEEEMRHENEPLMLVF
jgi:hypothetical protein